LDREINSYAILKNVDTTPFVAFRAFADYPEIGRILVGQP